MSDLIREALENLVRQQDGHPRSLEKLRRQGLSPDHPTVTATMEGHRLMMDRAWQQAREAISRTPYPSTRQQEVGSGWRPIESAPKGRTVLVGYLNRAGKWRTVRAHYYLPQTLELSDDYNGDEGDGFAPEGWYEEVENSETINFTDEPPTHWQPLPAAPSTPEKAGGVSDGVGGNDGVTPCSLCASHDLCKQHGCAGKALERERAARGVTPPAATFTGDELVRFYEEWEFNEEDPGEAEFIELVREVERRVLQRAHGVSASGSHPLPAQHNDGGA